MSGRPPDLPRTERDEAPMYLARYLERAARAAEAEEDGDEGSPLYLRRFRRRRSTETITAPLPPLWERSDHGMQMVLSEDNRNKEIGAPPGAARPVVNDVYLVRHAETQGYSTEAGITPLGAWQARSVGHTLARRVGAGEKIVLAHAATNRAGQTIEQIHRSVLDGLELFEKDVKVIDPRPYEEFRNFMVATPDGIMDVTSASGSTTRHWSASSGPLWETARPGWSRSTGSGAPRRAEAIRSSTGSPSRCCTSSHPPSACVASGPGSDPWPQPIPGPES